ncbi:MAG: Glu-tRNA(Gln) amidotransferase subunit GatD [Nanoarchaeota archaeon]|nr:Glu-tRNA(Gln) amidotransferase subunit GatD [Nanoarchaeota archaeon]
MKTAPGDYIKISTKEGDIEGIIMPTPELTGEDAMILKVYNGYNIGISKKEIKSIEVLKKHQKIKPKEHKVVFNRDLPTVSVLSTGGTISSKIDYRTGGVYADYTAKDFVDMMPELESIANINAKKIMSIMSEDMLASDWINLAQEIKKEAEKGVDGIIVTQGTDTLHFTTAAIAFMLKKINIPVIFTASQRSIDRGSSDAFMNLICAVKAAAHFDAAEVMSCLHGSIDDDHCLLIRGTKLRKMHTSRRDAFRPINDMPFAKVFVTRILKF